jgi:FkbM family methyltransferase
MADSTAKHMKLAIREAWYGLFGGFPATVDGTPCRCDVRNRKFWRRVSRGQWEPGTFDILRRFLNPEAVYVDVGAWIGPTVLAAARLCRHVYCFEPDPQAYERLLMNLRLNRIRNVTPQHMAIYTHEGFISLGHPDGLDRSVSSILDGGCDGAVRAACTTLQAAAARWQFDRVDLLKMDVEGAEFDVLPASGEFLDRFKPNIFLSLHAGRLPAEQRAAKMQPIVELARRYRRCLNRRFEPLEPQRLAEPAALEKNMEIILTNTATS